MATKRPAPAIAATPAPAQKRTRMSPALDAEKHEHEANKASTILKSVGSELDCIQNIIISLNQQINTDKHKLEESAIAIADLQAQVAKHERIERDYGIRYKWEEKLKAQKAEYDRKVQDLRESHASKQDLKDQQCKAKIEQLKTKHEHALITNEQSLTLKNDTTKEKAAETLALKEAVYRDRLENLKTKASQTQVSRDANWKRQLSELRASHKEQLEKVRANLKMVEAAKKVVELNAAQKRAGTGGAAVIKRE